MRRSEHARKKVDDYRVLLLAKRSELIPRCRVKLEAPADAWRLPEEDQVMVLHDEFVSMELTGLARETIRLIDAALERLDSGDYGICLECGIPIPAKRLQAIPWASHCVACQKRIEPTGRDVHLTRRAA
ncbi:MAG TPA: TraR/DksA family transcriptional regulator [Bryobacteraceae bacterium]|nr:TraR/DksA family transcriptional regulator [Bryobacteraceae bacterium]